MERERGGVERQRAGITPVMSPFTSPMFRVCRSCPVDRLSPVVASKVTFLRFCFPPSLRFVFAFLFFFFLVCFLSFLGRLLYALCSAADATLGGVSASLLFRCRLLPVYLRRGPFLGRRALAFCESGPRRKLQDVCPCFTCISTFVLLRRALPGAVFSCLSLARRARKLDRVRDRLPLK